MKKYLKYLVYVLKHKWFVFVECWKRGLIWQGITHDLSKFLPSEFIPYARYFYGDYPEYEAIKYEYSGGLYREDIERHFDMAWLKHIHRNPHHWQYWLLQEDDGPQKIIPMPIKYLKEMVCDWIGAGKAITGKDNIDEWYSKNKENIKIRRIHHKWIQRYFISSERN